MYISRLNISTTEVHGFPWLDSTDISIVLDKVEEKEDVFLIIKELLRFGLTSCAKRLEKGEVKFETNSSVSYYDFSFSRETDKRSVIKYLIDSFEYILNHKITFPNAPNFEKWYAEHLIKITDFFNEALEIIKNNKYQYYFQGLDGWN